MKNMCVGEVASLIPFQYTEFVFTSHSFEETVLQVQPILILAPQKYTHILKRNDLEAHGTL